MKKLITFLFLLTVYLSSAMATTVTTQVNDGKTFVVVSDIPINNSNIGNWGLSTADQNLITGAENLKLVGNVDSEVFNALQNVPYKTLDLSAAIPAANAKILGKGSLETLIMPTDPSYIAVPADFVTDAKKLSNIVWGNNNNIKVIGQNAFKGLTAYTEELNLPEGLEYIYPHAFDLGKYSKIVIPGTVKYISSDCFTESVATKVVFAEISEPYINSHAKKVEGTDEYDLDANGKKQILRLQLNAVTEERTVDVQDENGNHTTVRKEFTVYYPQVDGNGNYVFAYEPAEVNMTVGAKAFQNGNNIWDVYVETEGTIHCDNFAFSLDITNAHGDSTKKLSSLHFPADKAEDYVNMKHVLTAAIAASPERFHNWLNDHLDKAQSAANGWYEFANSGPSPDPNEPPISQYFLKTWSESGDSYTGYYKASTDELFETQVEGSEFVTYYMGRLVPDGVRAYIVNGITSSTVTTSTGSELSFKVTLKRLRVIPANTGVILYGQANSLTKENAPALTMPQVPYIGRPLTRDNWTVLEIDGNEQQSELKNFLIGTGDATEGNTQGVLVEPYDYKDGTTEVEFRNFFLGDFSKTSVYQNNATKEEWKIADDYVGFFRAKKSKLGFRKAYLHLKYDEFNDPNGNECIVVPDEDYDREPSNNSADLMGHKEKTIPGTNVVYWFGRKWEGAPSGNDWGSRPTTKHLDDYLASFRGEFEGEVDGIVTLTIPAEVVNDVYYTLQGVKVTNPTKSGIYIKNGKKVIIK